MNDDRNARLEKASKRWTTSVTWIARAQALYEVGTAGYRWWQSRRIFTVTVKSDDPLYQDVHDWLLSVLPEEVRKSVVAQTIGRLYDGAEYSDSDDNPSNAKLALRHDDQRERKVFVGEHQLKVMLLKPNLETIMGATRKPAPDQIIFTATSKAGQDAVVEHLRWLLCEHKKGVRRASLWLLNTWGTWSRRDDLPSRTVDSVILRDGQMERICEDLSAFLLSENEYGKRGIPWHRGYLLHGPPGTGKTSLAKALANHFNLDLWYAPLGDLNKDTGLLGLLSQVHPRSILLLEDVDVFKATHSEEAENNQLSLSGLLNALDGIATPHGLITIMTTNDRKALDQALLRPGRIDMHEEIKPPDREQSVRLYEYFHDQPAPKDFDPQANSVAVLIEQFKQRMGTDVRAR